MTSKLKCPVCKKPLEQVGTSRQYQCGSWGCDMSFDMIGTEALWQALIQAKQDLEIARKAFEMIRDEFGIENRLATPIMQGINMKAIAENTLEQIEHKE